MPEIMRDIQRAGGLANGVNVKHQAELYAKIRDMTFGRDLESAANFIAFKSVTAKQESVQVAWGKLYVDMLDRQGLGGDRMPKIQFVITAPSEDDDLPDGS
jgi:hypothetical protein